MTRFAPSPTGLLHMGHLVHLLYLCAAVRHSGATLLLRLEDHDRQRCRPEYGQATLEDIAWLGLCGFFAEPWPSSPLEATLQSRRAPLYESALGQLGERGLLYRCRCSRADITRRSQGSADDGQERPYDGHCRGRQDVIEAPYSLRLCLPERSVAFEDLLLGPCQQTPARQCGDMALQDRDGNYSYNFCCAVDDLLQGVNLIVRGADVFHCTGRQELLKSLLRDGRSPATDTLFLHHPLLKDTSGEKLGKSRRSKSLQSYRAEGHSPGQLFALALTMLGHRGIPDSLSLDEALHRLTAQG